MKLTIKSIDILYRFVRYLYIKELYKYIYVVGFCYEMYYIKITQKILISILIFRFCYTADDNPHSDVRGSNVPCEDSH